MDCPATKTTWNCAQKLPSKAGRISNRTSTTRWISIYYNERKRIEKKKNRKKENSQVHRKTECEPRSVFFPLGSSQRYRVCNCKQQWKRKAVNWTNWIIICLNSCNHNLKKKTITVSRTQTLAYIISDIPFWLKNKTSSKTKLKPKQHKNTAYCSI